MPCAGTMYNQEEISQLEDPCGVTIAPFLSLSLACDTFACYLRKQDKTRVNAQRAGSGSVSQG